MQFATLLDVGCGDGRFIHEAKKRFPNQTVSGIDFSKRAVDFANAFNPQAQIVCGDITDDTVFSESFDIITLIETLEHIPPAAVAEFIEGIHENLAEDGLLLVTVPSVNRPLPTKHYQHFSTEILADTLSPLFHIKESIYLNRYSILLPMLQKFLINRLFIVNNRRILNWIYNYYTRHHLVADEDTCGRILIIGKKINKPDS